MVDHRPIFQVVGLLLSMLGAFMMVPAIVDILFGSSDWIVFFFSSIITLFFGVALWASSRGAPPSLTIRQAFLMTNAVWVTLAAFGALPLYFSELELSYTDSFFESMSGLTTTGSTVIVGLDFAPPGILLWRSILQWLGGLGIIVMALAVMPMLQVGGMQLFKVEAFDTSEKILPRAAQISGSMTLVYVAFTALCALAYDFNGMGSFDAVLHAMTTIATGGFSSRDASIGHFDSAAIDTVAIVFMIAGSLPFILFLKMAQGAPLSFFRDSQVRLFLATLFFFTTLACAYQIVANGVSFGPAIREGAFSVVSIMTGTGYANSDYYSWGPFAAVIFFIIMFIGGCAGSTSCGIKIFRFQVLIENVRQHLKRILFPHGIFPKMYNRKPLADSIVAAVMTFLFLYFLCVAVLAVLLSAVGLDTLTAFSASATAISNVGPGLGEIIGPAGNFAPLPDAAKWLISAGMLIGRLELLTVLVLLVPRFWVR